MAEKVSYRVLLEPLELGRYGVSITWTNGPHGCGVVACQAAGLTAAFAKAEEIVATDPAQKKVVHAF